jgi:hypothetical protein
MLIGLKGVVSGPVHNANGYTRIVIISREVVAAVPRGARIAGIYKVSLVNSGHVAVMVTMP